MKSNSTLTSTWRYHLMLLGMALIWGSTWSLIKISVQAMPALTAASIRFWIGAVSLFVWILYRGEFSQLKRLSSRHWIGLAIASFCGIFCFALFSMSALQYVSASRASTVPALNTILPILLGALLFKERLNLAIVLGMLMSLIGGLIAIGKGDPISIFAGGVGIGEYYLLICVLCWAIYTLIGRVILKGIAPLIATFSTTFLGSIMLLIACLYWDGQAGITQALQADTKVWLSLILMGIGSTALGYLWFFAGVQHLGAGAASTYMVLIPIFGITTSAIGLGETIDLSLLVGGSIAILGMILMNWARG